MSAHTELAVYETFEDIFGQKSTLDELIADLKRFDRQSLLWICAETVTGLQLWNRPDLQDEQNYLRYLQEFFDPALHARLLAGYTSTLPRKRVFHRRQILLIAKLAVKHCSTGQDARTSRRELGEIFLKANDRFDYGLLRPGAPQAGSKREEYCNIVTEMLAVNEGASPAIAPMITRSHLMCRHYVQELSGASDFVDVSSEFEREAGLTVLELEAMLFGTHARFGPDLASRVIDSPDWLPLTAAHFPPTVARDKVDAFLCFLGGSHADFVNELNRSDNGANDVTVFRKYPMIDSTDASPSENQPRSLLLLDNLFALEKIQTGPYWAANTRYGDRLRTFWGKVFECYTNDLLANACAGTVSRFIPDPSPAGQPDIQICDGLVVTQDAVVLMEYKSSMFRADTKYSGVPSVLLKEIETKLVRNSVKGTKKGVLQLASAIDTIFGRGRPSDVLPDIDWTKVKTVHLCLLTLDSIGGTIGISALLNTYLEENLDRTKFPSIQIRPLYCFDVAALERISGHLRDESLPSILDRWSLDYPEMLAPLSMVRLPSNPPPRESVAEETMGGRVPRHGKRPFPGPGCRTGHRWGLPVSNSAVV